MAPRSGGHIDIGPAGTARVEVRQAHSRYEVHSDQLSGSPSGEYEFAVRSVSARDGATSDYHMSTARNARPETGWYLAVP
ncbi:MAG: hypothetical protein ACLFM0_06545 [Spirochaetales bacterium]